MPLKKDGAIAIDGRYNGLNLIEGKLNGEIVFSSGKYFSFTITITADSLIWNFPSLIFDGDFIVVWGDGTTTTNELSHTYATEGTYIIKIKVPVSNIFTFSTTLTENLTFNFPDAVYANHLLIDWGDENITVDENDHIYSSEGTYVVVMKVGEFDYNDEIPMTISDDSLYYCIPDYSWTGYLVVDWGDGSITVNEQCHLYSIPGNYIIRICGELIYPNFSFTISLPSSQTWSFPLCTCAGDLLINWGDGSAITRNLQSHYYSSAGTYTISLDGDLTDLRFGTYGNTSQKSPTLISINSILPASMSARTNFDFFCNECINLTNIPNGLFSNCINANSMWRAFTQCQLTHIPPDLFTSCTNLVNVDGCFASISTITSIPDGLFSSCPSLGWFSGCFYYCINITSIPSSLFSMVIPETRLYDLSQCFEGCVGLTGAAPAVWRRFDPAIHAFFAHDCFKGCVNLSNYNAIPGSWK